MSYVCEVRATSCAHEGHPTSTVGFSVSFTARRAFSSAKQRSGISGANTRTQRMKDIYDSAESFVEDAKCGKAAKKQEVMQVHSRPEEEL